MAHKYDKIVPHLLNAFKEAQGAGLEARILAKGGLQSLLIAHYLGHELSAEGQGYDAADQEGNTYEYKATSPSHPQLTYALSKRGSIDDAIEEKLSGLSGVAFAVIGTDGIRHCYIAKRDDFAAHVKAHFARIAEDVQLGKDRRGQPRAEGTLESRSMNLTEKVFSTIPNVVKVDRAV